MSIKNRITYYKKQIKSFQPYTQGEINTYLDTLEKMPESTWVFVAGCYCSRDMFPSYHVNNAALHLHTFFKPNDNINRNYIAQDIKKLFNNLYEVPIETFILACHLNKMQVGVGISPNLGVFTKDVRDAMELFCLGVVLI